MNEKIDLGQDLTVEELRSLYFDEDALRLPPIRLFRINSKDMRIYYTFEKKSHQFFPGVTGFLKKVLPTSPALINWQIEMGDRAEDFVAERAAYGSLMHTLFAVLLIERQFDLETIHGIVSDYCEKKEMNVDEIQWSRELKKDIVAFAQWMIDFQVKPLAIEVPLCTWRYGIATLVDLVCKMMIPTKGFWGEVYKSGAKAGQPKETTKDCEAHAIVDFKSRKKYYVTETDELQLAYCEAMVKENYPEFEEKDFRLFSWHPKDWVTAPGSYFTEHTNKHTKHEMELLSELYHLKNDVTKYTRISFKGVVELSKKDLAENFSRLTLMEIVSIEETKLSENEPKK